MENTAQAFKLYIIFSTVKKTNSVQEKHTHQQNLQNYLDGQPPEITYSTQQFLKR
jgi:hypothetical protein